MKLSLLLPLFLVASNALACLDGTLTMNQGNVILSANHVQVVDQADVRTTVEMEDNGDTISWNEGKDEITVSVAKVTGDHARNNKFQVIDAIFLIETKRNGKTKSEYIKMQSSYRGKGMQTRGMPAPDAEEFEISDTIGCGQNARR